MAELFKTCAVSVSVSALLLAAAMLAGTGAGADEVTTKQCRLMRFSQFRIRQYPEDGNATVLWMYACNIADVNYDDLANLPNVDKVVLHSNAIAHIDPALFRSAPKLTQLELHANKISELPVFGKHSCPSLTMLAVSSNLLSYIRNPRTFSACSEIRILYLMNNNIMYIHPNTFSVLTELAVLYLSGNKLTYIHKDMFARNRKLTHLELFKNRLTYLPSDFVVNLKRAGINLVSFYFYSNPWQCACLLGLLGDVKSAGVTFYKRNPYDGYGETYYKGRRPECVYVGAVSCRRAGLVQAVPRDVCGGR